MLTLSAITVTATDAEKLEVLSTALCNGLSELANFGMSYDYSADKYEEARARLAERGAKGKYTDSVCFEDILTEMLAGGGRIDIEDEENGEGIIGNLSMVNLLANWDKVPPKTMLAFINEEDDAYTAVDFIQVIALGSIVYG